MKTTIMKNVILMLLLIFTFFQRLEGQDAGCYQSYDFKSYLLEKTQNSDEYIQKIEESIRYMAIAKENKIEGRLEFILINHGNNESEIILKTHGLSSRIENFNDFYLPYAGFESTVKLAFEKIDAELLNTNDEKFITEFSILFKLESSDAYSGPSDPSIPIWSDPLIPEL